MIEERRQSILELLNFSGSIPSLFTSQPFVQFFEVYRLLVALQSILDVDLYKATFHKHCSFIKYYVVLKVFNHALS